MASSLVFEGKKFFFVITLFVFSVMTMVVLAEFVLRFTVLGAQEYQSKAVAFAMDKLRPDKDLGYLWKSNLDIATPPPWYDQELLPLVTDDIGFFNAESAIEKKRSGERVNIVGLGDSFMHGASYEFFDFFQENGKFFYNMSMSRHCPPQYNIILQKYALPLEPELIIYSIYENDFDETLDFENWQLTSTSWFSFHSGTWFGNAVRKPRWRFWLETYAPGFSTLETRLRRRFRLGPPSFQRVPLSRISEKAKAENVFEYIKTAYKATIASDVSFLCVLIPARDLAHNGLTMHDFHYNIVLEKLNKYRIPTLDLRPIFNNVPERKNLYYKIDAHWNRTGMRVAAKEIFQTIK